MHKIKDTPTIKEKSFQILQRESEKNIPYIVKAMLFTVIGMGFSCFDSFEGVSPFSVSFLSAVPFQFCLPTFIGSTLGYFVTIKSSMLLKYISATLIICLFRLIMNKRFKEKEGHPAGAAVSFSALFITGAIYLWFDDMSILPALILIAESIVSLLSSLIFIKAFALPLYKGCIASLSQKDIFSLVTATGITMMCLCSISIQGLSPARILIITTLMLICLFKGVGASVTAAAVTGIFLSFSAEGIYLFPTLVAAGLIGGFLSVSGQTVLSLSYTAVFFTVALINCDISESWTSLIEPVIACGIFLLMPTSKICEFEDYIDEFLLNNKNTEDFALAETLKTASVNMEAVAGMVSQVSNKLDKIINPEVNRLFSRLQRRVCENCEKKPVCWNKCFDKTAYDILQIMGVEKPGQGIIGLSATCKHYDLLCNALTADYPSYCNAIATKNKITEMRRILTDQFSGMSDFLYELSVNISRSRTRDKGKSAYLESVLKDSGIHTDGLDCYFYSGRITVEVFMSFDDSKSIKEIKPLLEFFTKRPFDEPKTEKSGCSLVAVFREKASYTVKSGYAQRSMRAGNLCGDTVASFTCDCGNHNFLISDGMGTGSRAAIDSNLVASVIEKLVSSSFSFESACKTVNNALIIKSTDESTATVDAVQINPYNCKACFFKAGGTISLIRRAESITVLEKASLPLGIIRNAPAAFEEIQLKKGDIILLLSDGVTNNDCGWINDELLAWSKSDMQSLANHIASLAAMRSEAATRDDITVVALRIEKAE